MELDKIIGSFEKYLREFVLYLLSFFWGGKGQGDDELDFDQVNRSVLFAILSAAVGAYLWNRYIPDKPGAVEDMAGAVLDAMLRWLSFGVLLYGLLRAARIRLHILKPILAVLKTFSVAHVVSTYLAYAAKGGTWMFYRTGDYHALGSQNAALVAYIAEFILLCVYMPREILTLRPDGTARATLIGVSVVFLLIVGFVSMARFVAV